MILKSKAVTNPHICSQCDSTCNSCCTLRSETPEDMPTPISEPEIFRIMTTLKISSRQEIVDKRSNSPLFTSQMGALFPNVPDLVSEVFPEEKNHYELKTVNSACLFLSEKGCTLPNRARPLLCRIYPFWFFDDQPQIFQDPRCLALGTCKTVPELYLALGTNPDTLRGIYSQLCQEWGVHPSRSQMKMTVSM